MSYSVNPSIFRSIFAVPADVVDKHIRLASGDQLKVLLWILRNSPENPDIDKMCKALKMNKSDAEDYLQYWVLTGVLIGADNETNLPTNTEDAAEKSDIPNNIDNDSKQAVAVPVQPLPASKPSSAEIACRIEESPEIGYLFNEAQIKLGKTIGYDGQCVFLLLHDHYGLPIEVIFMVIDYCVWAGKTNYGYIEAVGKDWGEKEIDDIDKAADKITQLKASAKLWNEFANAVGIKSPRPTIKQTEYIARWSKDYGFGIDMIIGAYEEMADHTGKLSFAYMDKIMKNWHEKGYKSLSDVEAGKLSVIPKNASSRDTKNSEASSNASYDLNKFKSQSLLKPLKYERKKK